MRSYLTSSSYHLKFVDILFIEDSDTFMNALSFKIMQAIYDFKVNLAKSDLIGLNVDSHVLYSIASMDVVKLCPLTYLGVLLGGNPLLLLLEILGLLRSLF